MTSDSDGQANSAEDHPGQHSDSAGQSWSGRDLKPNPFSGDTGEADRGLLAALEAVRAEPLEPAAHQGVLAALSGTRLYAPIVPMALDHEVNEQGLMVDNSSEMAMVRLQAEDGRECTPGFSAIPPLTAWHAEARPVPIEAERLVLGAIEADSQLVVLDPGADSSFLLRRPAMFAFVKGEDWTPSWADAEVGRRLATIAESFGWLARLGISPGSHTVNLGGPELGIRLGVESEVPQAEVQRFQEAVAGDEELVAKIDSLAIRLTTV
ncbi:MAG: SseB family protein [Brevibacterium sp.]